jgi:hypothetical protein
MEEALVARLRSAAAVAARVAVFNGRPTIDWVSRPDRSSLPALTIQGVDAARIYAHGGGLGLENKRVQFDCWGATYGAARLLARAVIAELETVKTVAGTAFDAGFLVADRDMMAEDLGGGERVHRISLDFSLWFKPA